MFYVIIELGDNMIMDTISMNVDVKLFEYLNSNENLSENQKKILYDYLCIIKSIYDKYIGNYVFDNVSELIRTLKIQEIDETSEISYDKNSNTLMLGKLALNHEYNTYKSLFELTSQSYDEENHSYNSGIIIKSENGTEYGKRLNDLIISKLIAYNTGYTLSDESIANNDELVKNITDVIGSEKLVTYFAYGNGKLLFSELFSNKNISEEKLSN